MSKLMGETFFDQLVRNDVTPYVTKFSLAKELIKKHNSGHNSLKLYKILVQI